MFSENGLVAYKDGDLVVMDYGGALDYLGVDITRTWPVSGQFTPDQLKTFHEIARDLSQTQPMNRLLQGDVGAGKTAVALAAMLVAVTNRHQAAMMAPTETTPATSPVFLIFRRSSSFRSSSMMTNRNSTITAPA